MDEQPEEPTSGPTGEREPTRAWISFGGLLPLDGKLPGTEGDRALQAQLAELARKQRDPEWQARVEARGARWRASMARGEPAAALVPGPLPHGADALVIRDPSAAESRLIVLSERACTIAHIRRARHGLTQSEMGTPDVPHRVEIALWLDGRVRIENADGRVREWTERWQYVGGAQPEREREFLARFDGVIVTELPGLGVARLAPGYPYPRSAGEPQVADHPIRLTDARRRRIAENFDPDAVEQIANLLPVEERRHFLRSFGGVPGEAPAPATREQQDFAVLVRHSDPKIEALIEQMWTPWWDHEPAAALDDPNYNFPGKELAKKRRLM